MITGFLAKNESDCSALNLQISRFISCRSRIFVKYGDGIFYQGYPCHHKGRADDRLKCTFAKHLQSTARRRSVGVGHSANEVLRFAERIRLVNGELLVVGTNVTWCRCPHSNWGERQRGVSENVEFEIGDKPSMGTFLQSTARQNAGDRANIERGLVRIVGRARSAVLSSRVA